MAGKVWNVASTGGYLSAKNLSKIMRLAVQPMVKFRQFCDVKDAALQGKGKGAIFNWNVYSNVATGGAALTETSTMPQTNFTISQASLTITEYGNAVPYTGKLDDLSEVPVTELIQKVLKLDCVKTLDAAAFAQFNATPLIVSPLLGTDVANIALTTSGTASTTNNVSLRLAHVKNIIDLMKERNIPAYIGDDYIAIARPATLRDMKTDLESVFKYQQEGFGMLLSGEIGRYENMRFVEQTNIASANWTNAKSDQVFFCGEDTVAEAVAVAEELRGAIPSDFGRSMGVAWYYLGGFGLTQTAAANARIVKWGSIS